MKIIPRTEWGHRYGLGWTIRSLPADSAWLHHAVTHNLPPTATRARENQEMQLLDRIGYDRFRYADTGWSRPAGAGISYSVVVFPSGRVYQGHDIRRSSSHTSGHNTRGIGIAVPGNTDTQDLTPQQVEAIAQLLVHLWREGVLRRPRLDGGHRDTGFPTSCPGNHAYRRIGQINDRAAAIAAGSPTSPVAPPAAPDVAAPRGSRWRVTATGLNGRRGPGTTHPVIAGAARDAWLTATGTTSSGPWVEATDSTGQAAWWHSTHLSRATWEPDPHVTRAQAALNDLLGDTLPEPLAVDGDLGPLTHGADALWRDIDPTTPPITPHKPWADHLEDTMSTLTDLATTVARIDRRLHDHMQRTETVTVRRQTAPLLGVEEGRVLTVEQLHDLVIRVALRNGGQVAGLESALESLAEQTGGVDPEAVKAAARTGAQEALAALDFEVTAVTTTTKED